MVKLAYGQAMDPRIEAKARKILESKRRMPPRTFEHTHVYQPKISTHLSDRDISFIPPLAFHGTIDSELIHFERGTFDCNVIIPPVLTDSRRASTVEELFLGKSDSTPSLFTSILICMQTAVNRSLKIAEAGGFKEIALPGSLPAIIIAQLGKGRYRGPVCTDTFISSQQVRGIAGLGTEDVESLPKAVLGIPGKDLETGAETYRRVVITWQMMAGFLAQRIVDILERVASEEEAKTIIKPKSKRLV
jgi:hypothetical protein